tara:strand:+ start:6545 stop:7633 length:1089 start_codon:yes stop_codon:yes gene_type:complete
MNIGIDAKWLYDGPVSGKLVVKNLIENFTSSDQNQYTLIVKKKDMIRAQEEYGAKFRIIPVTFFLNNLFTNIFIMPLLIFTEDFKYIIFQNFGSFIFQKKSVVFIHDLLFIDYPKFFSSLEGIYYRFMIILAKNVKLIVTSTQSEKERILKHLKIDRSKILISSLGADHINNVVQEEPNDIELIKGRPFVFYLGRLDIRKNLSSLLQAFKNIDKSETLLIIGGSPGNDADLKKLQKLINDLGISHRVLLTGYIQPQQLSWYFKNAVSFCFPSYAEGFGLPPLEAMMHGCPVICSNTTSMPEVCGDAALYIDPYSVDSITAKLNEVTSDNFDRDKFVQRGFDRAKIFKWKDVAKKIENKIKKL